TVFLEPNALRTVYGRLFGERKRILQNMLASRRRSCADLANALVIGLVVRRGLVSGHFARVSSDQRTTCNSRGSANRDWQSSQKKIGQPDCRHRARREHICRGDLQRTLLHFGNWPVSYVGVPRKNQRENRDFSLNSTALGSFGAVQPKGTGVEWHLNTDFRRGKSD